MRTLTAAALAFLAWAALAQSQVLTPPRQIPELDALSREYAAQAEAAVQDQLVGEVADLNKKYAGALLRAQERVQQSGNLEAVLAFKAELQRINVGRPLADKQDEAKDPEDLKALRETYRTALAKLDAERDLKLLPLNTAFAQHLDEAVIFLTKEGRLDDALLVRQRRKGIVIPNAPVVATEKKKEGAPAMALGLTSGVKTVRFQATVPATDVIKIANGILWIEDHAIAFYPYNIKINGHVWKPVWGGNRTSDKYDLTATIAPITDAHVTLHRATGRGTFEILTQPNADNAQTFSFRIYDPQAGDGNYDVTISW